MKKKSKVVVAMSGGVDSSVAAALLKKEGHEVIGMMLRLWSEPGKEDSNRCCTPESVGLARRAAGKLDLPFYVVDVKIPFRRIVVDAFLDGYGRGETPNPCLLCNRQIRFGLLLDHALAMGADHLATGHYALAQLGTDGAVRLFRAVDAAKDQSYVLHVLSQPQLAHAMFPLGPYRKSEVRAIAAEHGLPTANRHDSQDLCFLAGGDYRDFIRRNRPDMLIPGDVVDLRGQVLGRHSGLAEYTIGQRKGLGLSSAAPLYVLRKDISDNRLVVGGGNELGLRGLVARGVNWVSGNPPIMPLRAEVKTRYTARPNVATVQPLEAGDRVRVIFDAPQRDITSGQAAVIYVDDEVIGGGIIE